MIKRIILSALVLLTLFSLASAHPGRTDSSGGHYNRSSGEYHYHHGYPEHQHPNGTCPYNFDDKTGENSRSSPNTTNSYNRLSGLSASSNYYSARHSGYEDGWSKGYEKGSEDGYTEGAKEGFDSGLSVAYAECKDKINYLTCGIILAVFVAALFAAHYFGALRTARRINRDNQNFKRNNQLYIKRIRQLENRNRQLEQELSKASQMVLHANEPPLDGQIELGPSTQTFLLQENTRNEKASFGKWNPKVHDSEKQFRKYQRAMSEPLELFKRSSSETLIKGSKGDVYITTLNTCTCPDFNKNEHGKAPCKHIYFLAIQEGLPVAEIFEDYMKP